jgi:hypothetical protein
MKKFSVTVKHVDSYTGMVKYNFGGKGLTKGVKDNVERFCGILLKCAEVQELKIVLLNEDKNVEFAQQVLEPLTTLNNVRKLEIEGKVTQEYTRYLERTVESSFGKKPPRDVRTSVVTRRGHFLQDSTCQERLSMVRRLNGISGDQVRAHEWANPGYH